MNETENNGTVKTASDALAFLKSERDRMKLPAWTSIGLNLTPFHENPVWSLYGNPPGPYRFVSTQGGTPEEAYTAFRAELGNDKLRAEIEKLQAQLAQVEGGAV